MFSDLNQLKQKTPPNGIDRKEYISLLVDEFYETTDIEAKEQVTANLANFSYDPINYAYLKAANAVELFLELIVSPNSKLTLHGIAGLCNLCLDPECHQKIICGNGIELISTLLNHESNDIVSDAIATLLQLNTYETHTKIYSPQNQEKIENLRNSPSVIIRNLATVFLQPASTK